jgi:hypothetical protein
MLLATKGDSTSLGVQAALLADREPHQAMKVLTDLADNLEAEGQAKAAILVRREAKKIEK